MAYTITTCIPQSAKLAFLNGVFLPGHNYYMALYLSANLTANLGATTTAYTVSGEISGTQYVGGGQLLSGYSSGSDTSGAYISFANPAWGTSLALASFSCDGAMIYDASVIGNPVMAIISFGSVQTVSSGILTAILPFPVSGTNAIITGD